MWARGPNRGSSWRFLGDVLPGRGFGGGGDVGSRMREPRLGCGEFLGGSVGVVSVLGPGLLFADGPTSTYYLGWYLPVGL
jgi:hypothetical protein